MSKYYLMLLIPFILSASNYITSLQISCDTGNEKACIELKEYKSKKKDLNWDKISSKFKRQEWKRTGLSAHEALQWIDADVHASHVDKWKNVGINNAYMYKNVASVSPESLSNLKNPKIYAPIGKELAIFKEDCIVYENINLLPKQIQKLCQKYIKDVDMAFKIGYELDKFINSDKLSDKKLEHYYKLLINADKKRENIVLEINKERYKALSSNDVKYYNQLLLGNHIELYPVDYTFMTKHPDKMKDNPRYIKYITMLEQEERYEQERKKAEEREQKRLQEIEKIKKKKEREEHNKRLLAAEKQDLEKQISQNKTDSLPPSSNKEEDQTLRNVSKTFEEWKDQYRNKKLSEPDILISAMPNLVHLDTSPKGTLDLFSYFSSCDEYNGDIKKENAAINGLLYGMFSGSTSNDLLLGSLYWDCRSDYRNAVKWLTKVANTSSRNKNSMSVELSNDLSAMAEMKLGNIHYSGGNRDYDKALYWFTRLENRGYTGAEYWIAAVYNLKAFFLSEQDPEYQKKFQNFKAEELKYIIKSAKHGEKSSQSELGKLYFYGDNVHVDKKKAAYWLHEGSKQGDLGSQYLLATLYDEGDDEIKKDRNKAIYWYLKVSENEDFDSNNYIALSKSRLKDIYNQSKKQ